VVGGHCTEIDPAVSGYFTGTSDGGGSKSKKLKSSPYKPPGWEEALPYPSLVFTMEEGVAEHPPLRMSWSEEDDEEVKRLCP